MAPELTFGDKPTRASDVWSLGIVLHQILFGNRPEWTTTNRGRHLHVPANATSPLARDLLHLCGACLRELPSKRLPDAAAVKRRFEMVVGGAARHPWKTCMVLDMAAVALAAVALAAMVSRSVSPTTPLMRSLPGTVTDLERVSVPLLTTQRLIRRCAQLLPGGKTLRLFLLGPVEAVDVDLAEGRSSMADLLQRRSLRGVHNSHLMGGGCCTRGSNREGVRRSCFLRGRTGETARR